MTWSYRMDTVGDFLTWLVTFPVLLALFQGVSTGFGLVWSDASVYSVSLSGYHPLPLGAEALPRGRYTGFLLNYRWIPGRTQPTSRSGGRGAKPPPPVPPTALRPGARGGRRGRGTQGVAVGEWLLAFGGRGPSGQARRSAVRHLYGAEGSR